MGMKDMGHNDNDTNAQRSQTMNITKPATSETFGVEIECFVTRGSTSIGSWQVGARCDWLPTGWTVMSDCSVRTRSRSRMAVEIVSPVLKGVDGLRQIQTVVAAIKEHGGAVNATCGLHVHVGSSSWSGGDFKRLVQIVGCMEKSLFASTGTHSREDGIYCRTIRGTRGSYEHLNFSGGIHNVRTDSRYHILNLNNAISRDGFDTAEFRCFAGTLNAVKILAAVQMVLAMVERARNTKSLFKWTLARDAVDQPMFGKEAVGNFGEAEVLRWGYWFGWGEQTKQDHVWGVMVGEGLPTATRMFNEVRRLGRKYGGTSRTINVNL
jgi:hypothetical protein